MKPAPYAWQPICHSLYPWWTPGKRISKYDILKHPNVALTADGKAKLYTHGDVKTAVATVDTFFEIDPDEIDDEYYRKPLTSFCLDEDLEASQQ